MPAADTPVEKYACAVFECGGVHFIGSRQAARTVLPRHRPPVRHLAACSQLPHGAHFDPLCLQC